MAPKFITSAQTVIKYPLVIASKYNIPFLLDHPGFGHLIQGEVYEVDDLLLQILDDFEGHPEFYVSPIFIFFFFFLRCKFLKSNYFPGFCIDFDSHTLQKKFCEGLGPPRSQITKFPKKYFGRYGNNIRELGTLWGP